MTGTVIDHDPAAPRPLGHGTASRPSKRHAAFRTLLELLAGVLRLLSDDLVEGIRAVAQRIHDVAGGELVRRAAGRS